jgi:hypothetical protein
MAARLCPMCETYMEQLDHSTWRCMECEAEWDIEELDDFEAGDDFSFLSEKEHRAVNDAAAHSTLEEWNAKVRSFYERQSEREMRDNSQG